MVITILLRLFRDNQKQNIKITRPVMIKFGNITVTLHYKRDTSKIKIRI
jgi:hypothetical protein